MKILFKILLLPVVLALTIFVAVCRFICTFSSMVLSILASLLFLCGLGCIVLLRDLPGAVPILIFAFAISPYGIPAVAQWLTDRLDDLNGLIKAI